MSSSARWVEDFSAGSIKAIGALEILAAVGLILPAVLDIAPVLVPLAALGLVLIMVGAAITRIRRHEVSSWWRTWSISPWPASWRGAASAPSPSPANSQPHRQRHDQNEGGPPGSPARTGLPHESVTGWPAFIRRVAARP